MKIEPPHITQGDDLSPTAVEATGVLIAEAISSEVDVLNVIVNYTTDAGEEIGVYEISVRRLSD